MALDHLPERSRPDRALVSIILVTHNSADTVGRCLRSLGPAAGAVAVEVIVVDTGSRDRTLEVVRESGEVADVLLVQNQGFASAANAGAAKARGTFLLFLNPDTELPRDAVGRLLLLCGLRRVGAVSGLLVNAAGSPEAVGEPFPTLAWYVRRRFRFAHRLFSDPHSVPWLSGAALMVSAEAFRAVEGFREVFFLYYEDIDLCRRLRGKGYILLLDPGLRILHAGGRSAQRRERLRASDEAEDRYFSLHRPAWEGSVLRFFRRFLRYPLLGMLPLALVAGFVFGVGGLLPSAVVGMIGFTLFVAAARQPDAGALLLLASVLPGQLARIPFPGTVEGVTFTDALLPLVLGAWALAAGRRRSVSRRQGAWGAALLLPFFALLPGLLLAAERLPVADWLSSASYAVRLLLILALIPLGQQVLLWPRRVLNAIVGSAAVLALLGFAQLWQVPSLAPYVGSGAPCPLTILPCSLAGFDPHTGRLFSTWLDPNLLGGFFVMALGILLGTTNPSKSRHPVIRGLWLLSAAGVILGSLILTKSRTSLGAFLAVIAAAALVVRPWRRIVGFLSLGLLGAALVPGLAARFSALTTQDPARSSGSSAGQDPTARLRAASWMQAVEHVTRFPFFGTGYNAYAVEQFAVGNIGDVALHSSAGADNSLLTFVATMGLWGAVLLGVLLGCVWWVLFSRARRGIAIAAPAVLALSGLLAHAQFTHSLVYVHLAVPLALLLGAALGVSQAPQHRPS